MRRGWGDSSQRQSGSGLEGAGPAVETSAGEGALSAVVRKEVFDAPCFVCGFGGCDTLTSIPPENKPNGRCHAQ